MDIQNEIDQNIKRLEWVLEDIGTSASMVADVILKTVPKIRTTHPQEALNLLQAYSFAFSDNLDETIAESEQEIREEDYQ